MKFIHLDEDRFKRNFSIVLIMAAPLWQLCFEGKPAEARAAPARGEDVNSKDETSNTTALMWAVRHNVCGNAYYSNFGKIVIQNHQHSMARLLLKQPSLDVNCKNNLGETALHCAVDVGNIQGSDCSWRTLA